MRRKISAIIISIILSIVGIIPTMSITYAVSNDTITENCIYRTSVKHKGVSEPNYWSFVSTLVAYDNGHIRMDVQCVTCHVGLTCNEIGSIQFSDNMIAPVGTIGYGGISTFKPKNSDSKYLTSYTTQDIIYTLTYSDWDNHLSGVTLMSFDLYVKEPYLNTNQKIIFFGNEIEIPFEKESVKPPTETTSTTTATTTTTTTSTITTTTTTHTTKVNSEVTSPTDKYALGDVNGDGSVDGTDAGMVLREYAVLPEDRTFTEVQIKAGDINNDGAIDASDAGDILRYFAEKGAGYEGDDMELWLQSLHYHSNSIN